MRATFCFLSLHLMSFNNQGMAEHIGVMMMHSNEILRINPAGCHIFMPPYTLQDPTSTAVAEAAKLCRRVLKCNT